MPEPVHGGAVSRRRLLTTGGSAGVVGVVGGVLATRHGSTSEAAGDPATSSGLDPATTARLAMADDAARVGALPLGLAQPIPAFGHVLVLDLVPTLRHDPKAARGATRAVLTRLAALADEAAADRPEPSVAAAALDLRPAALEITPGLSASLLTACGLADRRPEALVDLPAFATDRLVPALTGGDLLVQVGAEDPMKVTGAVQAVVTAAVGFRLRWSRPGFQRTTVAAQDPETTVRTITGHRDGTGNPALGSPLWTSTVVAHEPGWMQGGSYLVARQIMVDLDRWFDRSQTARDEVIGRNTVTGAALGRHREEQPIDLGLRRRGRLVVSLDAHVRLAGTSDSGGARIYRRSWNFDDGWGTDGRRAGLIFLAWQADPRRGFIPIQESLTRGDDALNAFTTHVGSAVVAVPARGEDAYAGQQLLEG